MIIAISGTPATGKTATAKIIAERLGANLVSIPVLVKKRKIKYSYDKTRKTKIVSEKEVKRAVASAIIRNKTNVVEGHVAHLIKSDFIFILRCNPRILEKRMKKKGWPRSKIAENIEAEILDVIAKEAVEANGRKVLEIDTSSRTPRQTAALVLKILNNHRLRMKYRAGRTDWTEKYRNYLIRKK